MIMIGRLRSKIRLKVVYTQVVYLFWGYYHDNLFFPDFIMEDISVALKLLKPHPFVGIWPADKSKESLEWWCQCLVGGLGTMEFYDYPFSWKCHHPNWQNHMFQRGRSTTNQMWPELPTRIGLKGLRHMLRLPQTMFVWLISPTLKPWFSWNPCSDSNCKSSKQPCKI